MTAGPNVPLAQTVDKSGFPFQLAVERELRRLGRLHSWPLVATEVPVGETFADLVLQQQGLLGIVECKRVEDEKWFFLVPKGSSANVARCRTEWRNPRATTSGRMMAMAIHVTKLFCTECTMAEGSYEASVCVVPKGKALTSLEAACGDVLTKVHTLGDKFELKYDDGPTYLIPIIVTNADLCVCEYVPDGLDINRGHIGAAEFKSVDFIRFRKTLVTRSSNDYEWDRQVTLGEWTTDRERTVFIVNPRGLNQFLSGFRAFKPSSGKNHPDEFENPPEYGDGSRR